MEYKLKRIGVLSLGTLVGLVYAILTLLFAWPLIFIDAVGGGGVGTAMFLFFVIGALVGGFITGAVVALIYNILFAMTGGLTVELEAVREASASRDAS